MAKINILIAVIYLALNFPQQAEAYLKINEVYSRPITGQQEWIELYLPDSDPTTNVSDWSLWDTESSPSLLFTFEEETFLSAGDYFVISTTNKLNNSGDTIVLKDANYNFIDVFSYTGGESEKSWSLMTNGLIKQTNSTKSSANFEQLISPTPVLSPTLTPTIISNMQLHPKLTSFMACPKVGSEWVELKNTHEVEINLENYELWDSKNRFYRFAETDILAPQETIRISPSSSILNNGGDTLNLYSPNNELVESTSYEKCDSLISWEKNENGIWVLGLIDDFGNQSNQISTNTTKTANEASGKILGETSKKSSYKPFKSPDLPDLKLDTTPPIWDYSENVVFFETPLTIWGGLSVIIGGLLMGGSNLWNLYVEKQTAQLKKFP